MKEQMKRERPELPNVPTTMEQVYHETVDFILAQGRALGKNAQHGHMTCQYRANTKPEDSACAAGLWIPDNRYFTAMEGMGLPALLTEFPFLKEFFPFPKLNKALQGWHDSPENWVSDENGEETCEPKMSAIGRDALASIAVEFDLTPHRSVSKIISSFSVIKALQADCGHSTDEHSSGTYEMRRHQMILGMKGDIEAYLQSRKDGMSPEELKREAR